MLTRLPATHDFSLRYRRAQREARGYALGDADYVGSDAEMLRSEELPRPTHTCLDLVRHEEHPFLPQELHPLVILWSRHHVSSLSRDRFLDEGRHLLDRNELLQILRLEEIDTVVVALGEGLLPWASIAVWKRKVDSLGEEWEGAFTLNRLAGGQGQGPPPSSPGGPPVSEGKPPSRGVS